jgi:hypothetical protein
MTPMRDPVDEVLRLVAEGRLTAEQAAPILDALESPDDPPATGGPAAPPADGSAPTPRYARIEVLEGDRTAVNLRVPLSLGRMAMAAIPGLSGSLADQINEAIDRGAAGAVLDILDEDGDGVRVTLE